MGESWWFAGQPSKALKELQTTFEKARKPIDKVHSWVLQSRIFTQTGDPHAAFRALKLCLGSLGLEFEADMSWEQCDAQFHTVCDRIRNTEHAEFLVQRASREPSGEAMGGMCQTSSTLGGTLD